MFDPLDLYTAEEEKPFKISRLVEERLGEASVNCQKYNDQTDENEDEDYESILLDVLDLPSIQIATPKAILCVLLLLQPSNQVNFEVEALEQDISVDRICSEKCIPSECLKRLVGYYNELWKNHRLNTASKVCSRIPILAQTQGPSMLKYYTSVLKHFENSDCPLRDEILKQVSLRIAENCGRTAQPAMSRKFTFEGLPSPIEIYEPSLTADNLGWKTWGASFILSQKLINVLAESTFNFKPRVLELGSGTGLAGISWLCKWVQKYGNGHTEIFLTDLPVIVANLQKNVEVNKVESFATVSALDWTDPTDFINSYTDDEFDILIVSDPIYSPNHPELVVNMIKKFLSSQGQCYLEIPLRPRYAAERKRLRQLLSDNGFKIIKEEVDQGMEDWGMVDYLFLEIVKKC
ncbi:S-adenosylmethionine-dependent methyltransferase TDEL_0D01940 [Torulaspora delbrueckii]|uniref:Uncharacterized protein n=1 Tax=Torulaspora delbrueckii TaxID=4950 RepID=G8ZT34_TORDE|nr:hypothetical protein TDEL_0D01940 [Torulaspora delbrueckii]CCE91778.1 hypothetical protein TDEL_0D01940 [Torulaspora delbrueckii]